MAILWSDGDLQPNTVVISRGPIGNRRARNWMQDGDHIYTRCLRCKKILTFPVTDAARVAGRLGYAACHKCAECDWVNVFYLDGVGPEMPRWKRWQTCDSCEAAQPYAADLYSYCLECDFGRDDVWTMEMIRKGGGRCRS